MIDQNYILPDGRILSYKIYGPDYGYPIIYCHGTPSSRLEPLLLHAYGISLNQMLYHNNIKLIAIDRPGMGQSTFNHQGSFSTFADDVKELINYLQIRKCSVMAWSGGGPYALAIAHHNKGKVEKVGILCGFTTKFTNEVTAKMSMNKWYFRAAKNAPPLLKSVLAFIQKNKIKSSVSQMITGLPDEDYLLLKEVDQIRHLFACTVKEACVNGAKGAVHEAQLYFKHFSFPAIQQPVFYWRGTKDNIVIDVHAQALKHLPNSTILYKKNEGHLSLYVNHFEEVLKKLTKE